MTNYQQQLRTFFSKMDWRKEIASIFKSRKSRQGSISWSSYYAEEGRYNGRNARLLVLNTVVLDDNTIIAPNISDMIGKALETYRKYK